AGHAVIGRFQERILVAKLAMCMGGPQQASLADHGAADVITDISERTPLLHEELGEGAVATAIVEQGERPARVAQAQQLGEAQALGLGRIPVRAAGGRPMLVEPGAEVVVNRLQDGGVLHRWTSPAAAARGCAARWSAAAAWFP